MNAFLRDLEQAGRSRHTVRAYSGDLRLLTERATTLVGITPESLRRLFSANAALSTATRARRQAAVASFTAWAYREGLLDGDPMGRVARVRLDPLRHLSTYPSDLRFRGSEGRRGHIWATRRVVSAVSEALEDGIDSPASPCHGTAAYERD